MGPLPAPKDVEALGRRVAELEAILPRLAQLERAHGERSRSSARRRRGLMVGAVVAGAVIAGTAFADVDGCPNGLPVCFAHNTPALALDVNSNFAQVKTWLETKVGPTSSNTIAANAMSVDGGTVTLNGGNLVVNGGRISNGQSGNFFIESNGSPLFLNYNSQQAVGMGGVPGGYTGATIDNTGTLVVHDHVQSRLTNRRFPSLIQAGNCNASTCGTSCPAGTVIKMAFGFHGLNWNTGNTQDYVCTQGWSWMGSCIGQTSCTINTGCSTSAIWAECW